MQIDRSQGYTIYYSLITLKECDQLGVDVYREAIKVKMLQLWPSKIFITCNSLRCDQCGSPPTRFKSRDSNMVTRVNEQSINRSYETTPTSNLTLVVHVGDYIGTHRNTMGPRSLRQYFRANTLAPSCIKWAFPMVRPFIAVDINYPNMLYADSHMQRGDLGLQFLWGFQNLLMML